MITVDIKALLSRLNPYCTQSLEAAAGLCMSRTHYEVGVEHMLAKLLETDKNDLDFIFRHFALERGNVRRSVEQELEEMHTGNSGKPVFSPLLLEWFQEAWLISSIDLQADRVRSGALMLALLNKPSRFGTGKYIDQLHSIGRDLLESKFNEIVQGSIEQASSADTIDTKAQTRTGTTLEKYCTDFTRKAEANEIDPVFGRDQEINQMIDILARRRKNNPIIVGEAGVGKTALVEGLALRIVMNEVPDLLKGVSLIGLDIGLLQAGAGVKGEFENRLKSVIQEIKASPKPIILFIDEAHTLIGAGGPTGGSDAANLLKPALARGELRTIAATTWPEYKKYFEKDTALARRFQPVKLDEPSVADTILMLRGLKAKYEEAHGVTMRDDAITAAAELSSRYISGRQLPDKAIDLLDTSAARVKVILSAKPSALEDKERAIQALEREKMGLERDRLHGAVLDAERTREIDEQLGVLREEAQQLTERWSREKEIADQVISLRKELAAQAATNGDAGKCAELAKQADAAANELKTFQGDAPLLRIEVDPDVVAKVVSDWTGIPLGKVLRDQAGNIMRLDADLSKRIRGQEKAIETISKSLRASKAGLTDPRQPLGVFLLVGPSGVGKTETGLALADLLFGGDRFLVTINMSEFQESHSVSRLIGSPPGYVGYGEGGILTEAVRQKPYSVVLIDEAEKAHIDVMNLFYQVFDKGVLSDGEGRVVDFKNTVLFLTSNLGSEAITRLCAEEASPSHEKMETAIKQTLSKHFRPALLARMTIVPFCTLNAEYMKEIVTLKLDQLAARLSESNKMKLTYSTDVVDRITDRCTEVETGARNIDHIMRGSILPRMSQEILGHLSKGEMPAAVHLGSADDGSFSIHFAQ